MLLNVHCRDQAPILLSLSPARYILHVHQLVMDIGIFNPNSLFSQARREKDNNDKA